MFSELKQVHLDPKKLRNMLHSPEAEKKGDATDGGTGSCKG